MQNPCQGSVKRIFLFANTENTGFLSFDLRQKTGVLLTGYTVYQERRA